MFIRRFVSDKLHSSLFHVTSNRSSFSATRAGGAIIHDHWNPLPTGRCLSTSAESATDSPKNIAFVGLGNMGLPMCLRLLKNTGCNDNLVDNVFAFDTNDEALSKAEASGAIPATSVSELATHHGHELDIMLSMLPGCDAVKSVVHSFLHGISKADRGVGQRPLTFVDCSTISPVTCKDLHAAVTSQNPGLYSMLDAPVSGGVKGAEAATLTFMVGGASSTLDRTRPILQLMGKNVIHCGEDGGMGIVAKLCNNVALAAQMIGVCEALNLGEALGIDPNILADVMNSSTGRCWSSVVNNPHPAVAALNGGASSNGYEGGFASSLMLKDVGLAVGAGEVSGVAMPVGALCKEMYRLVNNQGKGKKDFGVILQFLRGK